MSTRTVAEYQALIRELIANDAPCQSPFCEVTMLGHLLPNDHPELVELVRELDNTDGVIHR